MLPHPFSCSGRCAASLILDTVPEKLLDFHGGGGRGGFGQEPGLAEKEKKDFQRVPSPNRDTCSLVTRMFDNPGRFSPDPARPSVPASLLRPPDDLEDALRGSIPRPLVFTIKPGARYAPILSFSASPNWLVVPFLRALLPILPFHFIFLAGQSPSNGLFAKITTCLCRANTKLYAIWCRLILCRRSCFVSTLVIIAL